MTTQDRWATTSNGWAVRFGSLFFDGGAVLPPNCPDDLVFSGCLTAPPDGVSGWGTLRTSDVTLAGRDGTTFGRDYYDSKQVTFIVDILGGIDMEDGTFEEPRQTVQRILREWRRACADEHLVVYPPGCENCDPDDPDSPHPVQLTGRPRIAQVDWVQGSEQMATLTFRFDAHEQVMELTDCCGTPGSGEQCVEVTPGHADKTRCYGDCSATSYRCYSGEEIEEGTQTEGVVVGGTECVCPTITATGRLTSPRWINQQTGGSVKYKGTIPEGVELVINPCEGTAFLNGANVSRKLVIVGDLRMQPGQESDWMLASFGMRDNGTSTICWTPAVTSA